MSVFSSPQYISIHDIVLFQMRGTQQFYTQAQVKCMYHNQNMTNTSHLYIIKLLLSDTAAMEGSFNNKLYIHYEEQGGCCLVLFVTLLA
jgi:hypothetical protein